MVGYSTKGRGESLDDSILPHLFTQPKKCISDESLFLHGYVHGYLDGYCPSIVLLPLSTPPLAGAIEDIANFFFRSPTIHIAVTGIGRKAD